MNDRVQRLGFYLTPEHHCSYLPGRQAVTLFADPAFPKNRRLYTILANSGFRRSGDYIYKPHCEGCSACIPVRIPVHEFSPRRKHKRTLARNRDLTVTEHPAEFVQEHYELYYRYIAHRHPGGGMDNPTPDDYMKFLTAGWMDTIFYEMRLGKRLLAVAVADRMDDGLSAVYTFYEPGDMKRSPGTFAILFEIAEAGRLGLDWLYLGYQVDGCRKMQYKNEFHPAEYFHRGNWQRRYPDLS